MDVYGHERKRNKKHGLIPDHPTREGWTALAPKASEVQNRMWVDCMDLYRMGTLDIYQMPFRHPF